MSAITLQGRCPNSGTAWNIDIDDGRVVQSNPLAETQPDRLPWLVAGMTDLQINGWGGRWFCDEQLTVDEVQQLAETIIQSGTPRFLATLITASPDALTHGMQTIAKACKQEGPAADAVAGIHLEGPWISAEDGPRGAHSPRWVRPCDLREFEALQRASGDRIRLVTLAPECSGAEAMIRKLSTAGILVAIGHTGASPEEIRRAVAAGASMSTHLGNAAHPRIARHPNYIWEQLDQRELTASVIADGHHLPDSVLRCFMRCKTTARLCLVSDASGFAGCSPGDFSFGDMHVRMTAENRIELADGSGLLAGSGASLCDCLNGLRSATNLPRPELLATVTTVPQGLLTGSPAPLTTPLVPALKSIRVGSTAAFTLLEEDSAGTLHPQFCISGRSQYRSRRRSPGSAEQVTDQLGGQ